MTDRPSSRRSSVPKKSPWKGPMLLIAGLIVALAVAAGGGGDTLGDAGEEQPASGARPTETLTTAGATQQATPELAGEAAGTGPGGFGGGTAKFEFASVSAGEDHTCGVLRDGSVECWGRDEYGEATPPSGVFA